MDIYLSIYIGHSVNAIIGGVGMLLGPCALISLNSFEKIQPRMTVATFNDNPSKTTISCYSPTNANDKTDLITLYNKLSSRGKNQNNKSSLHNASNRNGEHLTDFSLENGLPYLNTKFQKRKERLWTNSYANNAKVMIDYIVMNNKWINRALNSEAYSSFESVSSDHRIVTAKVRLSLLRNTTQTTKTTLYNWSLLNNKDTSDRYTITLINKLEALQKISETLTSNDEYEKFVNAHIEPAAECIPTKLRAKHIVP